MVFGLVRPPQHAPEGAVTRAALTPRSALHARMHRVCWLTRRGAAARGLEAAAEPVAARGAVGQAGSRQQRVCKRGGRLCLDGLSKEVMDRAPARGAGAAADASTDMTDTFTHFSSAVEYASMTSLGPGKVWHAPPADPRRCCLAEHSETCCRECLGARASRRRPIVALTRQLRVPSFAPFHSQPDTEESQGGLQRRACGCLREQLTGTRSETTACEERRNISPVFVGN